MEKLSDPARALVDQLRDADGPTDAAIAGGLERLRGELGDAIDAPGSGHAPGKPAGSGTGTSAAGKSSFALKLALAAAVSGGTVVALMLAGGDAPAPVEDATTPDEVQAPATSEPEAAAVAAEPVPAREAVAPTPPDAPATETEAETEAEPAPEPAARPRAAKDEGSNLDEELRLVRSATAASNAGDHAQALKLLAEHARRFPRGVLAGERELTRAKTLCASGDRAGARKVADRYVKRHAKSHLAARFDEVCRE